MNLDIAIEADWPGGTNWDDLATRAAEAAAQVAPELALDRLTASIVFTDDATLQKLNREWRGKDKATNVLSFPMLTRDELLTVPQDGPPVLLGDIALALETCEREATEKSVSFKAHATHLLVHGFLHLAGYDHETSESDAEIMEKLEIKALAILGIQDPYNRSG